MTPNKADDSDDLAVRTRDLAAEERERQELQRGVRRRHREALTAGAPPLPKGFFWEKRSDGGFTQYREIEKPDPGLHMQVKGVLNEDGWESMADDSFDPTEHGDGDNENLPHPAPEKQPNTNLRSVDNSDRDRRSRRAPHASGDRPNLASVSDKRREPDTEIEIAVEPAQQGAEINAADLLSSDGQLWRLEKYADRHGNTRVRRVLRFVSGKPPGIELGKVTSEIAEKLKKRTGKGRWSRSRTDAERYRLLAHSTAEQLNRSKGKRRPGKGVYQAGKHSDRIDGSANLPIGQDFTQWTVSDLRM